jgi:hypothetical protein
MIPQGMVMRSLLGLETRCLRRSLKCVFWSPNEKCNRLVGWRHIQIIRNGLFCPVLSQLSISYEVLAMILLTGK